MSEQNEKELLCECFILPPDEWEYPNCFTPEPGSMVQYNPECPAHGKPDRVDGNQRDPGEISDGYHTFNELYAYRLTYHAFACQAWLNAGYPVVKSLRHYDGEECFGGGWFIVSAQLPTGQVANHYPLEDWGKFDVPEVERAPEWDGHTPKDVLDRMNRLLENEAMGSDGERWAAMGSDEASAASHNQERKTS